jgi:hypothetical protein
MNPQQGGQGVLNIGMKLNVFVREDNSPPAVARVAVAPPKEEAQP